MNTDAPPIPRTGLRPWTEFLGLFVIAPIALAVLLPPSAMFPVLFGVTAIGIALLHLTPGFEWRALVQGWGRIDWRLVAGFTLVTAAICAVIMTAVLPERWFALYRMNPSLWLMIMLLYPLISALPQEIVFRPLFFRRYGAILPAGRAALVLNAAVFALAHLLYWNWIVAAMTFAGGLLFAWAYEVKKSFPMAVLLHAIAGNILFSIGLGTLFYTGSVVRPF